MANALIPQTICNETELFTRIEVTKNFTIVLMFKTVPIFAWNTTLGIRLVRRSQKKKIKKLIRLSKKLQESLNANSTSNFKQDCYHFRALYSIAYTVNRLHVRDVWTNKGGYERYYTTESPAHEADQEFQYFGWGANGYNGGFNCWCGNAPPLSPRPMADCDRGRIHSSKIYTMTNSSKSLQSDVSSWDSQLEWIHFCVF